MRCYVFVLSVMASVPAFAAPPPPPPEYVWQAAKVLTAEKTPDVAQYGRLFAGDVVVFENGTTIANDKRNWLVLWSKSIADYNGRMIGYSESSGGYSDDGGELLVIDTFDTLSIWGRPSCPFRPDGKGRRLLDDAAPLKLVHIRNILSE